MPSVRSMLFLVTAAALLIGSLTTSVSTAQETGAQPSQGTADSFGAEVSPFLQKYCQSCHNVDSAKGGIRFDNLTAQPNDRQLFQLEQVLNQIESKQMPPADEDQPSDGERQAVAAWISTTLREAREALPVRNGSIRRLTVGQYRQTLQDLLAISDDLTRTLPPDAVSKDGFTNNEQSMTLSPQQTETYFE
ncbi:MAG: DUF1587 domain-containing protein, partial [Planctomycetaceae bacterium]|nr:DUF1587 domain-containing protein [Planctomycetaceae bacterium]